MQVFPKIALSLSGGGYRAASFHLGSLEMLNELKLLESIKVLSTVSGGTITGASYALAICEKNGFDKFSADFREYLKSTNVIAAALDKLRFRTRFARSLLRQTQILLFPQPVNTFEIDLKIFTLEQRVNSPITESRMLNCQLVQPFD